MAESTERLIERLVAEGEPVRRLQPPTLRACLWLVAVFVLGTAAILFFADTAVFSGRIADSALAVEWIATLITGFLAVLAAFQLSLPDRSPAWVLLPLPSLAVWIASSGYSCWRNWIVSGPQGWELGESTRCFMFILAFSLPLGASLLIFLRRAAPLAPVRVAATGALGVAALAASGLQFFHPFDVTFIDLGVHLGTVALVVGAMAATEYVSVKSPQGI